MRLTIFGASGPTGRLAVQQAIDQGHHVRAVTRRPASFPLDAAEADGAPGVEVVEGDVEDAAQVERAVTGADAVISTYGVPFSRSRITVYSAGAARILAAMESQGVRRLVCVTSETVPDEPSPGDSRLTRLVLHGLLRRVVGRTLYDDMERMEQLVLASDLDWTIVRPGGLVNQQSPQHDYAVSTGRLPGHVTRRADLAHLLVREATEAGHPRQAVEVISRDASMSLTSVVREIRGDR